MKSSPKVLGFFQAAGLALYVSLFVIAGQQFQQWLIRQDYQQPPVIGIMLFLLAFIISALICGVIAFGYPIFLFFDNKKVQAVKIVLWTMVWLVVLFLAFIIITLLTLPNGL